MVDQVIKLKRNTANTNAPDTGDIVVGELAIGAVAGKLYLRKSDDSILTFSDDSNVSTTLTIAADSGSNDTVTVGTNTLTFNGTSNQIGTTVSDNAITIALSDDPVIGGTGSIRVPDGTTGQRPGSPAAGMFRYNTTTSKFEGYTDDWGDIGGGGANTFTRNAYTGDGSTTAFTLSQTVNSENDLIVFIEGVFQDQDAYSVSGTTLTFDTAPVNGRGIIVYSVKHTVAGSNLNIDTMTGDGSDTTLSLTISPNDENNTQVFIDGVYQNKSTYSISGSTLTFSTAPPNGSAVECMTFTQTDVNEATYVTANANNSTNETVYPVFVDGATGKQEIETDTGLTYNPSTGNLTIGGELSAATLDISGDIDIDGTLEADAITVNGTTLAETISDTVGAMVSSNTETGITVTYEDGDNTLDFAIGTLNQDTTGTAATVTTAAQPNITSLGTLTTLTVDNVIINGTTIGHTSDTDLITLADGNVTIAGELDLTTLDVSGDADIDGTLEADAITIGGVTLSETIADTVGAMVSSNTESGITVAYQDADNTLDFTVGTLNQDTTGTAATVTGAAQTNITSLGTLTSLGVDGAATFNESGAAVDFRIEGDTEQNLFFVDGSADMIGIGENAPLASLHIKQGDSGLSSLNAAAHHLFLEDTGANGPGITFASGTTSNCTLAFGDSDSNYVGFILYDNSEDAFKIGTNAGGEDVRIDSSGRVGINRTPAISNSKLEVGGADNVPLINVEASGVTGGMGVGATGLQLFHGTTSRMKITSDGVVNMPSQARAIRTLASGQTIANSSTTTVDWASNESTVGITYSSGEFTIPEAGVYVVHAYARFQTTSTGFNSFLTLHHKASGGSFAEIAYDYVQSSRAYQQMNINRAKLCAANDVMRIRVNHNQGGNLDLTGNSASCAISITKVA